MFGFRAVCALADADGRTLAQENAAAARTPELARRNPRRGTPELCGGFGSGDAQRSSSECIATATLPQTAFAIYESGSRARARVKP
jgi:hypothetical protein